MSGSGTHRDAILLGLALALVVSMTVGAAMGAKRGPVRQLASIAGLLAALVIGGYWGPSVGRALLTDVGVPWVLRGVAGAVLTGVVVWGGVYFLLRRWGRPASPVGETDRPVLGAVVGCWTGILWFALILLPVLALGAVGEIFQDESTAAPRALRWAMPVRRALADYPVTTSLAAIDPLPAGFRRLLSKGLAVMRDRAAFRRLQADEEVRALAASPAFYPLVNDPEINAMVRRRDVGALLSHPRVSALLADDEFQQRVAATDLEPMLDRALEDRSGVRP